MVRGSASSLLRLCSSSRNDAFRFRVLSRNLILGSAGNSDRRRPESHPVGQFYSLQNRGFFSGLLNKFVGAGKSDSPKSEAETSDKIDARASSSVVGDGDNFDNNSDSGGNGEVGFDKGDDLKSHLVGQFPSLQDRGVFSGLLNKISGADESDSPKPEVETSDKIDARVSSSVVGDGGGFDDNSDLGGNGEVGFDKGDDLNNGYEVMVNEIGAENGNGDVGSFDPAELYRELCDADEGGEKRRGGVDRDRLQVIFRRFTMSGWASNQALAIYIGASFFPTAAHKFETFFMNKYSVDVANYVLSLGPTAKADKFLFPIFVEYCLDTFPDEIKRFRALVDLADLTKPHTWFPFARAMKRKIVYHCGPTNSGKTYNALQRFMEAKKGIYCSPLRLLAMEVFDKVNTQGVYCSLLTGQEQKVLPFSNHSSCTVEMASTNELYEVAVIDEIQMMSDPYRGYAWTRALLGLMADEIHLCGDPSVLDVVRKICSETGDELCEHHYDRFKPLVVEAKTLLGDIRNVRSGDCVVAFSRREIFEAKLAIEKYTKHRCSVIYGALPPETRRQQATLFNDQDNEFDVLVASDAVGMGLNLNIRRVVFYSLSKYNGDKIVPVPAAHVKQIAGRAGRRGSVYPDGLATTLHLEDLNYLIDCLKQPFEKARKVGLFPFYEQVELFAGQIADVSFSQLLEKFVENCRLDGSYFFCRHDNIKKVANMLEKVPELSLKDRFNFCFAPVNIRDPKAMYHLLRFASSYGQKAPVSIGMGMPKGSARNDAELLDLETKHQVLSMYLWLSNHFEEESFPYVKRVEDMATDVADLLGKSLIKANWEPESRNQAGKPNPKKADGYERPRTLINSNNNVRKNLPLKEHVKKIVA